MTPPAKLTLDQWDARYLELKRLGHPEPPYGGPLRRHAEQGDLRLRDLRFDDSAAALDLWNFLLTEEDRLAAARAAGVKLVGAMKDLGTVPVMAYSSPRLAAFYPDGAWWLPCFKMAQTPLLKIADRLGVDESFCPVRAMLGAFVTGAHFPLPDLLTCSVGATCDDFSAIAQRLNGLGHPILWWEIPHRRRPEEGEEAVALPGGFAAPRPLLDFVRGELARVAAALGDLAGKPLTNEQLAEGIHEANRIRRLLAKLRAISFTTPRAPLPALELLVAEMLALHFCSDRAETRRVLAGLLDETRRRVAAGLGVLPADAVRVFWVNPVADLKAMNLLEACGGRVCGTDYLFTHALDEIPEDRPPLEALARMALADPMAGPAVDRAARIACDARAFGAEAVVIARIPGASHCALEGAVIGEAVRQQLDLPAAEIEIPPVSDALEATIRSRLQALIETARYRRSSGTSA
ncbi:MAG: 2-hydroxyacyl-CoA dehydratase [Kiritimatiellae bacterium]|nr:2-hydroxyacyl-CoA dehydratase [Kiritimatiellia bacterium]